MLKKVLTLFLIYFLGILLLSQGYIVNTIDPNGENAPAEIKELGLSFSINNVDIVPPKILMLEKNKWVCLFMTSKNTESKNGYLLFFNPLADNPQDAFLRVLEMGENPYQMTLTNDGRYLWVLNQGDLRGNDASISIVDLNSMEVVNSVNLDGYEFSLGSNMVFSLDGKFCYVDSSITDLDRNSKLLKIDCSTCEVVDEIFLGQGGPGPITISHDGTFLCVVNPGEDTVSIVDLNTFTEKFRIHFIDDSYQEGEHIPNFTYYTNVLLTPDDSIGFISSIGHYTPTPIQPLDKIYYFDPHTGERLKDENGNDICFEVTSNPGHLQFDSSGNYIICVSSSYNKVDTIGINSVGTAGVLVLDWRNVSIFKAIYMPPYLFNISSLSHISSFYDEDGKLRVVFPSFSTFDQEYTTNFYETLVDFDSTLHKSVSDVTPYNTGETRMMPVEVFKIPDENEFLVVNFLTNNFSIATLNENKPEMQVVPNFLFEDKVFSSVAFLNDSDSENTYTLRPYLASYIDTEDIRSSATPFYYTNENDEPVYIDSFDLTLNPHEQYVRMAFELNDELPNVTNQHGFLKVTTYGDPLKGVSFNGLFDENNNIIAGDYYNIGGTSYPTAIFPYLVASQESSNRVYFFNPYKNISKFILTYFNGDGTVADVGNFTPTIVGSTGLGLPVSGVVEDGYLVVRNKYNLSIPMYEAAMNKDHDSYYFFTCPPLYPYNDSSIEKLIVPFFAVGGGYDTHLILISYNDNEDRDGNRLKTNANVKLYSPSGELILEKNFQFDNLSKFQINFSGEDLLNCDKYKPDFTVGYAIITVDRDNVVGAFDFKIYHQEEDADGNNVDVLDNMAASEINYTGTILDEYTYPFAINIDPYITSYVVLNPLSTENTYHIEIYDSNGNLVTQSVNFTLQSGEERIFFIDDPTLFSDPVSVENFVGYMKIVSDIQEPFSTLCVQNAPDMIAVIPPVK